MLAQEDLLPPDGGVRSRVRIDLVAHEALRAPAPLTATVHASGLQDDRRRVCVRQERPRPHALLRFVAAFDRYDGIAVPSAHAPIPAEAPGVDRAVKDAVHRAWRRGAAASGPP